MSEKRFEQLKRALRFDDPLRRDPADKGAPIATVINIFNQKISKLYTASGHLTIDEMLIEFHGRVIFKQYIPSKPGKFGIKMYWVTEAETALPLKCLLYQGKATITESEKVNSYFSMILRILNKLNFSDKIG